MGLFTKLYPSKYKTEVNQLIEELTAIGKREDFLSERPGGAFNAQCRHIRAYEIGQRVQEIGDIPLMEDIIKKINKRCGKDIGQHLEYCWHRIGKF